MAPRDPRPEELGAALARLDEVTRRLRVECPWDREQDERSIVPHTVEEAYELAEAIRNGDDAGIRDELGDVLFQVVFLSLLLEERREGGLPEVAEQLTDKLIRRHPHVFGENLTASPLLRRGQEESETDLAPAPRPGTPMTADDVRRQWDEIKRDVEGRTSKKDERKPGLPALIYANKVQWKLDPTERPANAGRGNPGLEAAEREIGERLWDLVAEARAQGVDPELALRAVAENRAAAGKAAE